MNRQRIILLSVIAGLAILLLIILLSTKLFFLIMAGLCFFGASHFNQRPGIQRTFIVAGIIMLLVWFGTNGAVEFVEGGKKVWKSLFLIEFNFLVPLAILLGVWIYKKGCGLFGWRTILCVILVAAWIGGNSQLAVDGFNAFKAPITKGADPINAKGFFTGANKLLESTGKAMTRLSERLDNPPPKTAPPPATIQPGATHAPAAPTSQEENWGESFSFLPNKWDGTNLGWQDVITLEPGRYQIYASGSYVQSFSGGISHIYEPAGDQTGSYAYWQSQLPVPSSLLGSLVGKTDGIPFSIGKYAIVKVASKSNLYLSVNIPQNWSDTGHPASSFVLNRGEGFNIKIRRL